jgi:hypothetical protein
MQLALLIGRQMQTRVLRSCGVERLGTARCVKPENANLANYDRFVAIFAFFDPTLFELRVGQKH